MLYEAQAQEHRSVKKGANKVAPNIQFGGGSYVQEGNIQPAGDDGQLEYNGNANLERGSIQMMGDEMRPPIYRYACTLSMVCFKHFRYLFIYRSETGRLDGQNHLSDEEPLPPYIPKQRLIHFDLKGAPPKPQYLIKVLRLAKSLGATGLLLEYEDMFPFEGPLKGVAAKNHYKKEEIQEVLDVCQELDLEVIPLVQTFGEDKSALLFWVFVAKIGMLFIPGHLELLLKLPAFSHLRDVPEMPESICPCHPEAVMVVKELVRQVMSMHPKARFLHIGCDEVFHLGECQV